MGLFSKKRKDDEYALSVFDLDTEYEDVLPQDKVKPASNPTALTPEELLGDNVSDGEEIIPKEQDLLGKMRKRMLGEESLDEEKPSAQKSKTEKSESQKTLLEKCEPYILDSEGKSVVVEKPLYHLESVTEILREKSEQTLEALSQKYDISVDILKTRNTTTTTLEKVSENKEEKKPSPLQDLVNESYEDGKENLPDISDIDNKVALKEEDENNISDTATIRFTPIKDSGADKSHISVSSTTRPINLTGELGELSLPEEELDSETKLEETEFEDFNTEDDFKSIAEARKLFRRLSVKRRNCFLQLFGSTLFTVFMALFLLPPIYNLLIAAPKTGMIICTVILALEFIVNIDMLKAFPKIFSQNSSTDIIAAFVGLAGLALGAVAIYNKTNEYELILLSSIILFFRSLGCFLSSSAIMGNLRQIISSNPKKAVVLINNEATTFAMAKNSIEGDVLVAAPRKTVVVEDFMKHSRYGSVFTGKLRFINVFSLILAAVSGFLAAVYFDGTIYGFYMATAVLCLAALPPLFLIDVLPVRSASRKLNRKGTMIAGKTAAERLEMANAVTVSANELFPVGSVTLHNMQVLSDNNIDETIVRAASLSESCNSPLAPIFKRIAGTNTSYKMPESDTVKYEERLGLSGWVEDELLFIGNRSLMLAHGITVPDIEVDRKILRQGYFPVYLASGGKICALISVQYSAQPELARELRRLTGLGITLMVDNCDQNLTEDMICDYLGLYSGSVKVMSNAGVHMYRNAVTETESCSAPAVYSGGSLNFIRLMNCASRIKKSNLILSLMYILCMCFGIALFAYMSFAGTGSLPEGQTVLLYELGALLLTYILYLFKKP